MTTSSLSGTGLAGRVTSWLSRGLLTIYLASLVTVCGLLVMGRKFAPLLKPKEHELSVKKTEPSAPGSAQGQRQRAMENAPRP